MGRKPMENEIIKSRKIPLVSQQCRDPRSGQGKPFTVSSPESAVSSGDSSRVRDCHPPGMGTLYRHRPTGAPSPPHGQKEPGEVRAQPALPWP